MWFKWQDKLIKRKLINEITKGILSVQDERIELRQDRIRGTVISQSYYEGVLSVYKQALDFLNGIEYEWWNLTSWTLHRFVDQLLIVKDKGILNEAILGRLEAYIKIKQLVERYL